jgi:2-amino-4-hydroxy-6-hydroxymethyldihydropteridine diphosphokinase
MTAKIPVYLSLGSNLGDRMLNLDRAVHLIGEQTGSVRMVSRTFESAAWGYNSDNGYYNRSLKVETLLEASSFMEALLQIEKTMGRIRDGEGYSDRLIDLDILLYGERIIDQPGLTIPHPKMSERRFVLVPLCEIAAYVVHPTNGSTIKALLESCKDPLTVRPV